MSVDPSNAVLVHFYRAVVSHADVWRVRMDATTNWAAATTAGMVTFSFGNPESPHLVLLLAVVFDAIFLVMESRRYQVYDLWRRRFRVLNQYLVSPVLDPATPVDERVIEENLARVASDLGRTVPHLSLIDAIGYRIRRNYAYLFGALVLAWLAKLELHPTPATSPWALIERAAIGPLSGAIVMGGILAIVVIGLVLTLRAPSEGMLNWTTIPSPAGRLWATSRRWMPGGGDEPGHR